MVTMMLTTMKTIAAAVNAIESCNFPATAYTPLSYVPLPSLFLLLPLPLLLRLCVLASSQKAVSCSYRFPCQAQTLLPRCSNFDSKMFVMLLDGP